MPAGVRQIRHPRRDNRRLRFAALAHAYNVGSPLSPKHYIFNHIPKTAGISFLAVCRANLAPSEISPHLEDSELRLMPTERLEHYKLIRGHISLLSQIRFCRSRCSLIMLREPIHRIFSTYTYWRTEPYNPLTAKAKELSFPDFVRYFADSPAIIHNPYTHHLGAVGRDCAVSPGDERALLAAAKRNLSAFDFVGISEAFERSVRLLCTQLGWRLPAEIPHANRSSASVRFSGIDSQTMDILLERNGLDLELYDCAVELFNAREASGAAPRSQSNSKADPKHFAPFPLSSNPCRRAAIHSVSAQWAGDECSHMLEIAVGFAASVVIAELSLSIQVTGADGDIAMATSTWQECLDLAHAPGRSCRAVFLAECELPEGLYFVTVGLWEPRRFGFYEHWIDHATLFTVEPSRVARSRYIRRMRLQEFSVVDRTPGGW